MSAEELRIGRKHESLRTEWTTAGRLLNAAGMDHPADTVTISADGVARGPLSGGREQLTAWYVLECETAEQAATEAARVLDFHVTAVEVRHIHDSFGMA
jgi:hypothetical protein